MTRWAASAAGSGWGVANLPYGCGEVDGRGWRALLRIGDHAVDLAVLAEVGLLDVAGDVLRRPSLNGLFALGTRTWRAVRRDVAELLAGDDRPEVDGAVVPLDSVQLGLPVEVGDYVDFYASIHHATNLGRLFRPDSDPLLPNWRRLPVGYHGRSATVAVSGTDVVRPHGQIVAGGEPRLAPSAALDIELEVGFVVGAGNRLGEPIPTEAFADHVVGVCLVNDWSARDIQSFEYQPLGPFLGKSFLTSASPWITTLDALTPFRVPSPEQEPVPADYLRVATDWGIDLTLEVLLQTETMAKESADPVVISRTSFAGMYWTLPQMLAHATVNGALTRTGDLFASGTVSGAEVGTEGSLIELARRGETPIDLPDGSTRSFLHDGDTVVLRGWAGAGDERIALGEVRGTVLPARGLDSFKDTGRA